MKKITRREFHRRVGEGMLAATLGTSLASELGISTAHAAEGPARLSFGDLEPLVGLMQDTPADELQRLMIGKLRKGEVDLRQLMQAAALANARTFGGEDYVGMHTLMAMKPAFTMAAQLPQERGPLAVLKILHRNTSQIQNLGGSGDEVLHPIDPANLPAGKDGARLLREAVHDIDFERAEKIFAAIAGTSNEDAFNDLLETVAENTEVHRVVFVHRAWESVDLVGEEHAHTMLRQSLRYCLKGEQNAVKYGSPIRELLPKILDEYDLVELPFGTRIPGDDWVKELSETIFAGTPEGSARAVAAALKEGMAPDAIGEAISMATNQLVLRDFGRTGNQIQLDKGKPEGSVHGDSIGVHASDSANAWRSMAKVASRRNAAACLILGAYQATLDRTRRGGEFLEWTPRPHPDQLAKVEARGDKALLTELEGAIRELDQARACALVHRYGELDFAVRPLLDLLLKFAISEEGALHAEKYYLTTTLDYAETRPAFRWNHLVGLARVTASEFGQPAPGYREACEMLKVEA